MTEHQIYTQHGASVLGLFLSAYEKRVTKHMPRHYDDGRIFRLRSDAIHGNEFTLRLTEREWEALKAIDPTKITSKQRASIGDLIDLIITDDEAVRERLNRRFARIAQDGPIAHNVETTQDALPDKKKWSERLDDIYNIYRNAGIDGMTDEQAQDAYSNLKRIDRRDIGNLVRPARNELVKCGLIYNTGEKREVRSGNKAILWAVVYPEWSPPKKDEYLMKEQITNLLGGASE